MKNNVFNIETFDNIIDCFKSMLNNIYSYRIDFNNIMNNKDLVIRLLNYMYDEFCNRGICKSEDDFKTQILLKNSTIFDSYGYIIIIINNCYKVVIFPSAEDQYYANSHINTFILLRALPEPLGGSIPILWCNYIGNYNP